MKTIIVTEETIYSGIFSVMFEDIVLNYDAKIINTYLSEKSGIKKIILNVLYKNKINRFLKGSFEKILKPKFSLVNILDKYKNENILVIFTNASLQKVYSENNLKKIKGQYPKAKFILLFVDSIFQPQAKVAVELAEKNIFDIVYTYNQEDAKAFGYYYWETPYSTVNEFEKIEPSKGVYFCGSDKGRAEFLDKIASVLKNNNINFNFKVFGNKEKAYKNFKVLPVELKDYKEILKDTLEYNCILDIVQESNGEKCGLSLRAYEAVVYKRILITNNPSIKKFKYYDPSYMHFIDNENDIKKEWLTQKVSSNYSGELSPVRFINDIENNLNTI